MLDDHAALTSARIAYSYAPFKLVRAEATNAEVEIFGESVKIAGPALYSKTGFSGYSSWDLDQYHFSLLRSAIDEDVLLGVASVMFWGFAQGKGRFTTARALSRAKHVAGLGKRSADAPAQIVRVVRTFSALLDAGDRVQALSEAMSLKYFGLAFASKLLAFALPDTECVYDEVISLRLQDSNDARLRALYVPTVGMHRLAEKASAYEGWAKLCSAKAAELNHENRRWKDWDGTEREWRAVDVERAFFSLGRG